MQTKASSNPSANSGLIHEKLRAARLAQGEKVAAIVGLREAATLRLEMLKNELEPVVASCKEAQGFIDLALVPGFPARLWIDMVSYVTMAPNPRSYRFQRDCLDGHDILIESDDLAKVADTVANYIAHRLIERQHHFGATMPPFQPEPQGQDWKSLLLAAGLGALGGACLVFVGYVTHAF